jgi:hypothetical protein
VDGAAHSTDPTPFDPARLRDPVRVRPTPMPTPNLPA